MAEQRNNNQLTKMKDYYLEYWIEAVECACYEAGVSLTKEQATQIAGSMQMSHENQGMAFGHDCIPNPLSTELDNERRKKKDELKAAEAKGRCAREEHRQSLQRARVGFDS